VTQYQTFFLCGKEWKNAAAFVELVNWITPLLEPYISVDSLFGVGPKCVITVVKRSDYGRRQPSFLRRRDNRGHSKGGAVRFLL